MTMTPTSIGIIGTSRKPDERRVPVHPDHLSRLSESVRHNMVFETGYGAPFNVSDDETAEQTGGVASRSDIPAKAATVVIAKPILAGL